MWILTRVRWFNANSNWNRWSNKITWYHYLWLSRLQNSWWHDWQSSSKINITSTAQQLFNYFLYWILNRNVGSYSVFKAIKKLLPVKAIKIFNKRRYAQRGGVFADHAFLRYPVKMKNLVGKYEKVKAGIEFAIIGLIKLVISVTRERKCFGIV